MQATNKVNPGASYHQILTGWARPCLFSRITNGLVPMPSCTCLSRSSSHCSGRLPAAFAGSAMAQQDLDLAAVRPNRDGARVLNDAWGGSVAGWSLARCTSVSCGWCWMIDLKLALARCWQMLNSGARAGSARRRCLHWNTPTVKSCA